MTRETHGPASAESPPHFPNTSDQQGTRPVSALLLCFSLSLFLSLSLWLRDWHGPRYCMSDRSPFSTFFCLTLGPGLDPRHQHPHYACTLLGPPESTSHCGGSLIVLCWMYLCAFCENGCGSVHVQGLVSESESGCQRVRFHALLRFRAFGPTKTRSDVVRTITCTVRPIASLSHTMARTGVSWGYHIGLASLHVQHVVTRVVIVVKSVKGSLVDARFGWRAGMARSCVFLCIVSR